MENKEPKISRSEIGFWLGIIILACSGAVAFTTLRGEVNANYITATKEMEALVSREQLNKQQFTKVANTVEKMYKNQIKIGERLEIYDLE